MRQKGVALAGLKIALVVFVGRAIDGLAVAVIDKGKRGKFFRSAEMRRWFVGDEAFFRLVRRFSIFFA